MKPSVGVPRVLGGVGVGWGLGWVQIKPFPYPTIGVLRGLVFPVVLGGVCRGGW